MLRRLLLVTAIVAFGATGCAKHEGLPTQLSLLTPPTPSNFVVTSPAAGDFDLTWDISDPTNVDHYNVYLVDPFFGPAKVAEAATTTFLASVPGVTGGVEFGVAAVTSENVEGTMVFATAP